MPTAASSFVADFRKLALSMPGAMEGEHMDHPDFRLQGRVFASIAPAGKGAAKSGPLAMVKLPVMVQRRLIEQDPGAFHAAAGAWGRQGCTMIRLEHVEREVLSAVVQTAWSTAVVTTAPRPGKKATKPRAAGVKKKAAKKKGSVKKSKLR